MHDITKTGALCKIFDTLFQQPSLQKRNIKKSCRKRDMRHWNPYDKVLNIHNVASVSLSGARPPAASCHFLARRGAWGGGSCRLPSKSMRLIWTYPSAARRACKLCLRWNDADSDNPPATSQSRSTRSLERVVHSAQCPAIVDVTRPLHSSYERGCQEKKLLPAPPGDAGVVTYIQPHLIPHHILRGVIGFFALARRTCPRRCQPHLLVPTRRFHEVSGARRRSVPKLRKLSVGLSANQDPMRDAHEKVVRLALLQA